MKYFAVLFAVATVAYGGIVPAAIHGGLINTGASAQFRSQDNLGNYAFGYNEDHSTGGTFRRESGSLGVKVGSYGLRDIDGRTRVVNYVADGAGFRANIQTNEPGVEPKDPAAVLINKQVAVAPAIAPLAAAPLAVHAPAHYAAAPIAQVAHAQYAAPIAHAYGAPIAHGYGAYGAPLIAPAVKQVTSYSVNTAHAAPAYAGIAAAPIGYATGYAGLAAPLHAGYGYGNGYGNYY